MTTRSGRSRGSRTVTTLGLTLLVIAGPSLAATVGLAGDPSVAAAASTASQVQLKVADVSPSVPEPSADLRPITFALEVTNLSSKALRGVQIDATRALPVTSQRQLDQTLAGRSSAGITLPITPTKQVRVSLAPGETAKVQFVTTTGIPQEAGICLCHDSSVYPISFIAHSTAIDGTVGTLGRTITYLPTFYTRPKPVQVSWVWPLIDRPHRLSSDTVFIDDALRLAVQGGGRLDKALAVVEAVGPRVPVTLVLDPELLDELAVMATGKYRVESGRTRTVAGRGQDVAQLWLDRLRTVLADDPLVRVATVPYADPDLETSGVARIGWANNLPFRMRTRVSAILSGKDPLRLAWPATGTMGTETLLRITSGGSAAVLLSPSALRVSTDTSGVPRSLDTLVSDAGRVTAAMTSPALSTDIESAVSVGGAGTALLSTVLAELAVRTATTSTGPRVAVLTAPRYVDPVPADAVRTILDTSRNAFTTPAALQDLTAEVRSTNRTVKSSASATFPVENVRTVRLVAHALRALEPMLVPTAASRQLLSELPQAAERLRSAAWRRGATVSGGGPTAGRALSARVATQTDGLLTGVRIVRPSSGSYTLASSNSPLPITVDNRLDYAVTIRLSVVTQNGLPGYTGREAVGQLQPHSKSVIRIRSTVERSGRIPVLAQLSAPDGTPLGRPIKLFVHSTVLGTVGVVITIVAGAVLVLAVLVRMVRRLRARRTAPTGTRSGPRGPVVTGVAPDLDRPAHHLRTGAVSTPVDDWGSPTLYDGGQPIEPRMFTEADPMGSVLVADWGDSPDDADAHGKWSSTTYIGKPRRRDLRRAASEAPPSPPATVAEPPEVDPATPAEPGTGIAAEPGTGTSADADRGNRGLMAASGSMAVASLASRITGFLRSIALVAALGTGAVGNAYNSGNNLPNMIYELLLGGVLSSVLIPLLVHAQTEDEDDGVAYTQRLLSLAAAALGVMTMLAVLAAPLIASAFVKPGAQRDLTSIFATLLLPEIFFYGLGAMFMAVLNIRHVYKPGAWAPVLNNLIMIITVLVFWLLPGPATLDPRTMTTAQVLVIGIGTTLGIAGQALILIPSLRRAGQWQWRFRAHPNEVGRMREVGSLAGWVLGYVVVSQVGVTVIQKVGLDNGGFSIFTYADLLFQMPYGILVVSLLTAIMPRLSRAAIRGDNQAVIDDLSLGARLSAVALVPVTAGLIVLGPVATITLFAYGKASIENAHLIGSALAWSAFGLFPFALVMLQLRVFYAMRDGKTPTLINGCMVATKVALVLASNAAFQVPAGTNVNVNPSVRAVEWLNISTSLSYVVGALVGHVVLTRRLGHLGFRAVLTTVVRVAVASAVGAMVAYATVLITRSFFGAARLGSFTGVVLGGLIGLAVMAAVAWRMRIPEIREIVGSARGR